MLGESSTLRGSRRSACRCRLCTELAIVTSKHGLDIWQTSEPLLVLYSASDVRSWTQILTRYREPNHVRSTVEIVITFVPLATLWALAWAALHFGYWWLSLILAVPAAGFLVRLFMI